MSSARLQASLLEARERRQQALSSRLGEGAATIFLSLNIPGADKTPPGAEAFFAAMQEMLLAAFEPSWKCCAGRDALGPYAIVSVEVDAAETKRRCLALEASAPAARLADLDVYAADGRQLDRASLALPPRSCLVCAQAAVDCMRAQRHAAPEVIARVHELLAPFRT
jgi:holo-ACP synthase CitX